MESTDFTETALYYGSASLTGFMGKDNVCLGLDSTAIDCVTGLDFFVITAAVGLDSFNGVVGLGPSNPSNGPSFMQKLVD